jgi:hypothetical protein
MKTFIKFIKENKNKAYVPLEPIDFHMGYRETSRKINEENEHKHIIHWFQHNDNAHIGDNHEISYRLKNSQRKLSGENELHHQVSTYGGNADHIRGNTEAHHIRSFSRVSRIINRALIDNHVHGDPIDDHHHEQIKHLDNATNTPLKHEVHMYSGVGFDPRDLKSHENELHLPAYTSLTHRKGIAHEFATKYGQKKEDVHILHIHMQPTDKGRHISHVSRHENEHETILPRKTTLHVHDHPQIFSDMHGNKVHVWKAHVHHQE